MANIFNVAEVVDIGIEKERARRDFYALVGEQFEDKEMKALFARLRDWEDAHIEKFTDIRDEIKQLEPVESFKGEFESYMKALVDDKIYKDVEPGQFADNVTYYYKLEIRLKNSKKKCSKTESITIGDKKIVVLRSRYSLSTRKIMFLN